MVDLRENTFAISFVKIRREKIPRLIERARDHCSMFADTVRLVLDLD